MGIIKRKEIRGYMLDRAILCEKCTSEEQKDSALEDEILTDRNVDDRENLYFCDECKTRL